MVLLLAIAPAALRAAPSVVITVDVESVDALPLPDQIDAVCNDEQPCGLMEIVRMLRARQLSGTFFLNVYEHKRWGEAELKGISEKLQRAGQDLALHTHPQWAYDPSRHAMHQYNIQDQIKIIREGAQYLSTWTGQPVVAHRAGDYAADENTLAALQANGILLDSSLFWKHPSCKLFGLGLARNIPSRWNRVIEIPVTVYERAETFRHFRTAAPPAVSVRKLDAAWFRDEQEAAAAMQAALQSDLPVLVLFLHSFSLMSGRTGEGSFTADRRTQSVFATMLDVISEAGAPVVTMRDLAVQPDRFLSNMSHVDNLPRVIVDARLDIYLWHLLGRSWSTVLAIIGIFMLLLGMACVAAYRRYGTHHRWPLARSTPR